LENQLAICAFEARWVQRDGQGFSKGRGPGEIDNEARASGWSLAVFPTSHPAGIVIAQNKGLKSGAPLRKGGLRTPREPLPFDLRSLEIFLAVAETGNFTEAGKRLGLTQSAVSQTISQLEREFEVLLIDRKMKPPALTVAGVILRLQAHELLEGARRIMPMIRESVSAKLPILRIGLIESLFPVLAPVLGVELRTYANQLSMLSGLSFVHRQALLQRDIDVAVTTESMEDIDDLDRFPLLHEPFILLLPANRRDKDNGDLARLAAELPFIWYTERSHMGHQIGLHLRRLRLDLPRGQAYDSTSGVVSTVAAGLGWAMTTPLCMFDARPPIDSTFCIPLPSPAMSRQLMIVARSGEMGSIPSRITNLARQALETRCAPEIARMFPWLGGKFKIG
jgi:DNA-binding transcriptional LysR family regulator